MPAFCDNVKLKDSFVLFLAVIRVIRVFEREYMLSRKCIVQMKRVFWGSASAFISAVLILSILSAGVVSAYYTSGALGRRLDVYPGFSVNRDYLAPAGSLCRSTQTLGEFAGVTIHETSNWRSGANARSHAMYLLGAGQNSEVSWHYSVDSKIAYQSIPESEKAWHAGDKSYGTGNARTIAIEICDYNDDGNFDQAMANAEYLAADILYRHGIYNTQNYLFQHHDFSAYGKNCPITIRDTNRWAEFCTQTQMFLDRMVAAKGTIQLDDSDVIFSFSGTSPAGFAATRVDIYNEDYTWVGSAPAYDNTFTYELDSLCFIPGWHTLRFAPVDSSGTANWTTFSFLVGPPSKMSIDYPSGQDTIYEDVRIQGWALGRSGIARVDVFVDDGPVTVSFNQLSERADVDALYNQDGKYIGGLNCGFSYTINKGTLSPGTHTVRVEALSNDGSVQKVSRVFSVGTPLPPKPGNISTDGISVIYQTHVENVGWQNWVNNGAPSGTSGQSKRLEAIRIFLNNINGGVEYRTHVQDRGWQNWVSDSALSGTSGESKRLEAIQIRLTGEAANLYDIYYRVHAQDTGWMDWAKNGDPSGTAGYSYRLEAIEIKLVEKGRAAPGSTTRAFIDRYAPEPTPAPTTTPVPTPTPIPIPTPAPVDPNAQTVLFRTHIQDIGWQPYYSSGEAAGTSGRSKRMEAIQIKLQNVVGGIEYSTHVQDIGWMEYVADDGLSGTSGQSKRLEAIRIRLTGEAAGSYDIYYCVHAQNTGWLDWAKNGESAGTAGFSYRLEAIKIVLVPKDGPAPGLTDRAFVQK